MALRTFVVANPLAGAGQVKKEWVRIERMLQAKLPEVDFAFTEGPDHATLLTREALRDGWEMVVAIGGDGTFNEAVNGFFEKSDAPEEFHRDEDGWVRPREAASFEPINSDAVMGLLPMGTGGDFRKSVGITEELAANIDRLGGDETRPCDVGQLVYIDHDGRLASRAFINIASCGFSGKVDKVVNNMWKGLGGPMSFQVASTWAWLRWNNQPLEILFDDDDKVTGDFFMVAVANGEYFGGGMHVAPQARIDDGKFEVVVLGDLSKWESAILMPRIYAGRHFEFEDASRREARRVQMRATGDEPVLIDLDGEQPGRLPALYQMHPGAIRLKI